MTGSRFRGDARVRYPERAAFEDFRAQKRREVPRRARIGGEIGWWVGIRVGECLECFVGSEAVAWRSSTSGYRQSVLQRTNIQHQSFRGCFLFLQSMLAHAMHNWALEVNVEDGIYVREVEHHCEKQEHISPGLRHGEVL